MTRAARPDAGCLTADLTRAHPFVLLDGTMWARWPMAEVKQARRCCISEQGSALRQPALLLGHRCRCRWWLLLTLLLLPLLPLRCTALLCSACSRLRRQLGRC